MASFITPQETLEPATAGSISRHGARTTNRTLNQALGLAAGLLVAPSGTAGQECASPATAAAVRSGVGFSIYRPMSEDANESGTLQYADNEVVSIMEEGHMHVPCEGTVVADRPVYVRHTSDGGDNTVLGKVRGDIDYPAGGIVITPAGSFTAAVQEIWVTLSNGLVTETFSFLTDASPTTGEVAAGLVALIEASDNFGSTGTTTISVTSATGIVEVVAAHPGLTLTTGGRAERLPGAFFDHSRTGAGLVELRLNKVN